MSCSPWKCRCLGNPLTSDDHALQGAEPFCKSLLVGGAESIRLILGNHLDTAFLGAGHGIDFGRVDNLAHWYDFYDGIFLDGKVS